jgi:putative tricarboxylic transport membrane protein
VGLLLIAMAVLLALDIYRGGRGEQEGGEDVDLSHGSDWRTIGLLAGSFVANALLIERVGWPVSGAILFFGTTYALGSRHYVRNALISIALSVGTWYLFNVGLGIKLPVGILMGIL